MNAIEKREFIYVDIGRQFQIDGKKVHSKWRRVKLSDLPEHFKNINWGLKSVFCTALRYSNFEDTPGEPSYGPLYFDFDADKSKDISLEDVFQSANVLLDFIQNRFNSPKGAIRLWYSGGRSIHIEVNETILGVIPSEKLHLVYKAIARNLDDTLNLKGLDNSIYSSRRLWRYPGSMHHNGLYKVELDERELKDVGAVLDKAQKPIAALYLPEDLEFSINDNMADWVRSFSDRVKSQKYEPQDRNISQNTNQKGIDKVLECEFIQYCQDNAYSLPEPLWYDMISNLCHFAGGADAIHQLSQPYPEYSTKETDDKINHAIKASGPITCQKIAEDGFQCDKICSVKSPAGLAFSSSGAVDIPEDNQGVKFHLTDMGNGERLAFHHGDNIRYSWPSKDWYIWDGKRWKRDKEGDIVKLAKDVVRCMYIEAGKCLDDDTRKTIVDHARKSESKFRVNAMVEMCQSEPGIPVLPEKMDRNPWLLNCLNGTIDLQTGELLPHSKDDLITKLIPVEYNENAKSELWESFLNTVTDGDRALIEFLQRATGYSLTGDTREEKLFFIHGPSATGKSTFIESVKTPLSEYSATADFETFIKKSFDTGPRNDIAALAGARLVVSIEVDEGKKLAEGLVKMLTGGDTIRARFLYNESFEFLPQLKLWLVANHAPNINAFDGAMWRRVLRIPFKHSIPESERDETVKARLKDINESGVAILAWAVKGCLMWHEKGLAVPEPVKKATAEYRADMDILAAFINELCLITPTAKVSKAALYEKYKDWCKTAGEKPEGKITFGRRLLESGNGIQEYRSESGLFWEGVELSTDLLNTFAHPDLRIGN